MPRFVDKREYDIDREKSVCFSGHRPEKLPWGDDERDEACKLFKSRIEREILKAYEAGCRYFLSGMAEGFDIYAAEAVVKLAKKHEGMELVAVFPYGRGDSPRKRKLAEKAAVCVSISEGYAPSCYMERNYFLVRHSSRAIVGYAGEAASGTGATLRMALREGLEVIMIAP